MVSFRDNKLLNIRFKKIFVLFRGPIKFNYLKVLKSRKFYSFTYFFKKRNQFFFGG